MSDEAQKGGDGKPVPRPGPEARRARALLLLASGVPTERIAESVGLSVKTIQNLASAHAADLREAAERLRGSVVEATVEGAADALTKIRRLAPDAVDVVEELMRDGGDKEAAPGNAVQLRAALAVLDRGGVPVTTKNEHTGKDGGAQVVKHEITLADAVELAKEKR